MTIFVQKNSSSGKRQYKPNTVILDCLMFIGLVLQACVNVLRFSFPQMFSDKPMETSHWHFVEKTVVSHLYYSKVYPSGYAAPPTHDMIQSQGLNSYTFTTNADTTSSDPTSTHLIIWTITSTASSFQPLWLWPQRDRWTNRLYGRCSVSVPARLWVTEQRSRVRMSVISPLPAVSDLI